MIPAENNLFYRARITDPGYSSLMTQCGIEPEQGKEAFEATFK